MAKIQMDPSEQPTYAATPFVNLGRFKEAKSLLRKSMPGGARVLGESHQLTLKMRKRAAQGRSTKAGATLDDLGEAVTTFEEATDGPRGACSVVRIRSRWQWRIRARRASRAAAREGGDVGAVRGALDAMRAT